MTTTEGLRIDHHKDAIETHLHWGNETRVIQLTVEKQPELIAEVHSTAPNESQMVPADAGREQIFTGQRHMFSEEVVSAVRKVEEILLFGSNEARGELKKSLEGDWLGGIVELLETCIDTLTDHQMMKVREDF